MREHAKKETAKMEQWQMVPSPQPMCMFRPKTQVVSLTHHPCLPDLASLHF